MDSYHTLAAFAKSQIPDLANEDDRMVAEWLVTDYGDQFKRQDFDWQDTPQEPYQSPQVTPEMFGTTAPADATAQRKYLTPREAAVAPVGTEAFGQQMVTAPDVQPGPTDAAISAGLKSAARSYVNLGEFATEKLPVGRAVEAGYRAVTGQPSPVSKAIDEAQDYWQPTPDELAEIESLGLPAKTVMGAVDMLGRLPQYVVGGGVAKGLVGAAGGVLRAIAPKAVPTVMKIVSRIRPDVAEAIKTSGLGAATGAVVETPQVVAEEMPLGKATTEIGKSALMMGAGGLGTKPAGAIGEAIGGRVGRLAGETAGSAAGFGAGVGLAGGTPDDILSGMILGGAFHLLSPGLQAKVKTAKDKADAGDQQGAKEEVSRVVSTLTPEELKELQALNAKEASGAMSPEESIRQQDLQAKQGEPNEQAVSGFGQPTANVMEGTPTQAQPGQAPIQGVPRVAKKRLTPDDFAALSPEEQLQEYRRVYTAASTDPLTGLNNREGIEQKAMENGTPFSDADMVILDIDHFKRVNDTHGHPVGDDVLADFGDLLSRKFAGTGIVGRIGGEEFAIIPVRGRSLDAILSGVNGLRPEFAGHSFADGKLTGLTFSAGAGKGFKTADKQLYVAKRKGRNQSRLGGRRYDSTVEPTGDVQQLRRSDASQPGVRPTGTGTAEEGTSVPSARPAAAPAPAGAVASGSLPFGADLPKTGPLNYNIDNMIEKGLTQAQLGDDYAPKKLLLDVMDMVAPSMPEGLRRTKPMAETEEKARRLLAEGKITNEKYYNLMMKSRPADEVMQAGRILTASAVERLVKVRNEVYGQKDPSQVTDADRARVLQAMSEVAMAAQASKKQAREYGRAINMWRSVARGVQQGEYGQVFSEFGGEHISKAAADLLSRLDPSNREALLNFANATAKPGFGDKIMFYYVNALVSGIPGQMANILGSAVSTAMAGLPTRVVQAAFELVKPMEKRQAVFEQLPAEAVGFVEGLGDALKAVAEHYKTDKGQFAPGGTKLDPMREVSVGLFGKALQKVGTTSLGAWDDFFKVLNYRSVLNGQAKLQAVKDHAADKTVDVEQRYQEYRAKPKDWMIEKAAAEAMYRTFNKEAGPISSKALALRSDFYTKGGHRVFNPLKLVIPFVKTTGNIMSQALMDFSPVGYTKAAKQIPWLKKKYGIDQQSLDRIPEEMAKATVGTGLVALGILLARSGMLTGSGPKNSDDRKKLMATGWQPYSLHVGDKYVPLSRLEPLATTLGVAADVAEIGPEILHKFGGAQNSKQWNELTANIMYSLYRNITNKTMMTGVTQLLELTDPTGKGGKRFVENLALSPLPNLIGSAARASDPYYRYTPEMGTAFQARVPYLSQFLYPKRDIWGQPIERPGKGIGWLRFVSPILPTVDKGDRATQELVDNEARVSTPDNYVNVDEEVSKQLGLEGTQVKFVGRLAPLFDLYTKVAGKDARHNVLTALETPEYTGADKDMRASILENSVKTAQGEAREAVKYFVVEQLKQDKPLNVTEKDLRIRMLADNLSKDTDSVIKAIRMLKQLQGLDNDGRKQVIKLAGPEAVENVGKLKKKIVGYVNESADGEGGEARSGFKRGVITLTNQLKEGKITKAEFDKKMANLKMILGLYKQEIRGLNLSGT